MSREQRCFAVVSQNHSLLCSTISLAPAVRENSSRLLALDRISQRFIWNLPKTGKPF
jgi:hypothetical protein